MTPRHSLVIGLVALVALLAAACRREPTPPAAALVAEKPLAWRARGDGVGPIRVGMSPGQLAAAVGPTASAASADPTGTCHYEEPTARRGVSVMMNAGVVARVDVLQPGIATEGGIEVGASEGRVREVYGARVTVLPHKYTAGHYLLIPTDDEHRLVFETEDGVVTRYRVGRLPEVGWVEGCA